MVLLSLRTWPRTSSIVLNNRVKLSVASTYGRLHGIFFFGVLDHGPLRMSSLTG